MIPPSFSILLKIVALLFMCSNLVHGYHLCALQMSLDMHNVGWNVRADWSQYIIDV
jgi:hypothetical protein